MQRLPLFLRMLMRRARKGPSARYDVRWHPALPVPGADGSTLRADHYAPVTDDACPTVLVRAPYLRSGFPWNYLYGVLVAEQGFHVILQSCRGTGGSTGEFHTWRNEPADGQAAVAWLREQDWFTGELYTMGGSYMAYAQWALGVDPPPEWRAAIMQIGHADGRRFFWPGGAFALERSLVGGLSLFGQALGTRQLVWAVLRMRRHLARVISGVPLLDVYPAVYGGRRPAFEEWLAHPEESYWADGDLMPVADKLAVPVSLCTGWWDLAPEQVVEQYDRLRAAGHDPDLLIGPWTHTSSLEQGWEEVFGQALRRLRDPAAAGRVRVFVGGAGQWRDLPSWPPAGREERWFLGEGTLLPSSGPGSTSFRYEPSDPTPALGGPLQSKTQGQRDNAALEARADVLTFTGEPLPADVEVMGMVRAEFDASTTAASGDLFARLCDVDPQGVSLNVCDGLTRFPGAAASVGPGAPADPGAGVAADPGAGAPAGAGAGAPADPGAGAPADPGAGVAADPRAGAPAGAGSGRIVVEMGPAGHRFRAGHRIRLQVSGGAHPRFLRNYGTGEPPGPATRMVPTTTAVGHTSFLALPVV